MFARRGNVARFFARMTVRLRANGTRAQIILAHMCALADTVDTHPDRTRVPLEWSTALRDEVWPLFLQFQETVIATVAQTIRRWHLSRRAIEPKPLGRVRADCR